jgi:hypothetical protein
MFNYRLFCGVRPPKFVVAGQIGITEMHLPEVTVPHLRPRTLRSGQSFHSLFHSSSGRRVRAVLDLSMQAWATGRAPERAENRASMHTRHRAAAPIVDQHTSTRQWKKEGWWPIQIEG